MLLRGRLAGEARAALGALSDRYLRLGRSELTHGCVGYGLAGVALVHHALDAFRPGVGHRARAERVLFRAVAWLEQEPQPPSLFFGIAGVGWVLQHLVEETDLCSTIDDALARYLNDHRPGDHFDLFKGVAGIGVYALERMPRPSARALLARVTDHLHASAKRRRPGVAWWSDPAWLPPKWRRAPHPDWNLGVAHGSPGVIAVLARIVAADVDTRTKRTARALLGAAVEWLLAQELPRGSHGCFPRAVASGLPRTPARLAWCYGDAGIAATLLVAARCAREPSWERAAKRIARRAATRSEDTAGVVDASLCHGSAGLAHAFHRLYRTTGDERFADASRRWFIRTLAMRTPRRGFGGFRSAYDRDTNGGLAWRSDPGFLNGSGGVALALAAAISPGEPDWDRLLLLS